MRGYFSQPMVPRMTPEMTTLKFKSEVVFIMHTVIGGSPTKLPFQN